MIWRMGGATGREGGWVPKKLGGEGAAVNKHRDEKQQHSTCTSVVASTQSAHAAYQKTTHWPCLFTYLFSTLVGRVETSGCRVTFWLLMVFE